MSMTFTKLFSSITASTIWAEPDHTRLVWITMLAMADQHGRVWASIPGLSNMARVTIEKCEEALVALGSPDKYSRTKEHEGRRVEEIDGGWRLLNHGKYRAIRDEESIKQSKRDYINKRRAAERVEAVEQSRTTSKPVDLSRANTEADTEAESEAKKEKKRGARGTRLPDLWEVPEVWIVWARQERPELDPYKIAEKFADHWHSKPGAAGSKLDWFATWRNWVREERGGGKSAPRAKSFAEIDAENTAAQIHKMTGGIMGKPKPDLNTINMEIPNGSRPLLD